MEQHTIGTPEDVDRLLQSQPTQYDLPLRYEPRLHLLTRVTRSCKFEVEHSANVLIAHLKWREEHGVDEICKLDLQTLLQLDSKAKVVEFVNCFPVVERGTDRDGRRVIYFLAQHLDMKRAKQLCPDPDAVLRYLIWTRERSFARLKAVGYPNLSTNPPPYFVSVLDCHNVGLGMATSAEFQVFLKLVVRVDGQYAGRIGKMYIVNVPFFFQMIWGVVKNWFKGDVEKKIQICSSGSQAQVLADALGGESNVPAEFGGTGPALPHGKVFCDKVNYRYMEKLLDEKPVSLTTPEPALMRLTPIALRTPVVTTASPTPVAKTTYRSRQNLMLMFQRDIAAAQTKQDRLRIKRELVDCIFKLERDTKQFETDMLIVRSRRRRDLQAAAAAVPTPPRVFHTDQEVRAELEAVRQERQAWEKTMAFAKNYIEVQNQEWVQTQRALRGRLERVMDEHRGLCRTVQDSMSPTG
ncbi:hypothetical protein BASA81_001214 [Batrachochytrium salamandrivorans]|nr:hypothetical protein BASA81_001214 [Batrachochytrium salamandrivorans]